MEDGVQRGGGWIAAFTQSTDITLHFPGGGDRHLQELIGWDCGKLETKFCVFYSDIPCTPVSVMKLLVRPKCGCQSTEMYICDMGARVHQAFVQWQSLMNGPGSMEYARTPG